MTTKIVVTPESLEGSARTFEQAAERIQQMLDGLRAAAESLNGDWRGQAHASFVYAWAGIKVRLVASPVLARETASMLRTIATAFRTAEERASAATRGVGVSPIPTGGDGVGRLLLASLLSVDRAPLGEDGRPA